MIVDHVASASASIPEGELNWAVTVHFDGYGARQFASLTSATAQSNVGPDAGKQIAIVVQGKVISAPTNSDTIAGGVAIITGSTSNPFTKTSATRIAEYLSVHAR